MDVSTTLQEGLKTPLIHKSLSLEFPKLPKPSKFQVHLYVPAPNRTLYFRWGKPFVLNIHTINLIKVDEESEWPL